MKRVSPSSIPLKALESDFIYFPFNVNIASPVFYAERQSLALLNGGETWLGMLVVSDTGIPLH